MNSIRRAGPTWHALPVIVAALAWASVATGTLAPAGAAAAPRANRQGGVVVQRPKVGARHRAHRAPARTSVITHGNWNRS